MSQSALERRARILLRAYPAPYRRERGEEIIATLLEATPPGRRFPSARDTVALLAGGRHARAARHRGLSTRANLRLALLLGTALYLSDRLSAPLLRVVVDPGDQAAPWLLLADAALYPAMLLVPWLGHRAATTVVAVLAGTVLTYQTLTPGPPTSHALVLLAGFLIPLGALAALSGGPARLPGSWAWLLGLAPAALVAVSRSSPAGALLQDNRQFLLAAVVTCWLATDARPAFAFVVAELLALLLGVGFSLTFLGSPLLGSFLTGTLSLPVSFSLAAALPAAWLLRRQTAPGALPPP